MYPETGGGLGVGVGAGVGVGVGMGVGDGVGVGLAGSVKPVGIKITAFELFEKDSAPELPVGSAKHL